MSDRAPKRVIRKTEAQKRGGWSPTTHWRLEKSDPDFPSRVQLSKRLIGYFEDEFDAYLESRRQSNSAA